MVASPLKSPFIDTPMATTEQLHGVYKQGLTGQSNERLLPPLAARPPPLCGSRAVCITCSGAVVPAGGPDAITSTQSFQNNLPCPSAGAG